MNGERRGFTLVELLVVMVLGALLIAASLQVLITNQRTYTAQNAEIRGQQTTRAALDVLAGELREISTQGGDLLGMGGTSVTVRVPRKFGVVCAVSASSPPVLTVLKVGGWFSASDSVFIFADNNPSVSSDDAWISARITAVDTTASCGAKQGQDLSFSGQAALFTSNVVATGAPVRSFVQYRYGLLTYQGKTYLGRTDDAGDTAPLVGPLDASSGLQFTYLDTLGAVTATPTDVRTIQITIKTSSPVLNSVGNPVSDSVTAVVYPRN